MISGKCVVVCGAFASNPHLRSRAVNKRRLDEAMNHLREKNYVLASRFLRQVNFVSLVTCPLMNANDLPTWRRSNGRVCLRVHDAHLHSEWDCQIVYFWPTPALRFLLLLGRRKLFLFEIVTSLWAYSWDTRSFYAFAMLDSAVHVPANVLLAVMEIGHHFMLSGREFHVLEFAIDRAVFAILASGISVVLERTLRDRLAAQIRNMDSESIILAFRQMLRAVCDGEVLLDDGLCIQEGSNCLNRILFRKESLDKTAFRNILVQDSRP